MTVIPAIPGWYRLDDDGTGGILRTPIIAWVVRPRENSATPVTDNFILNSERSFAILRPDGSVFDSGDMLAEVPMGESFEDVEGWLQWRREKGDE